MYVCRDRYGCEIWGLGELRANYCEKLTRLNCVKRNWQQIYPILFLGLAALSSKGGLSLIHNM